MRIEGEGGEIDAQLADFAAGVNATIAGFQALANLREAQRPFMRLYRDVLLAELRGIGIINIAEQEANRILRYHMTYFKPGDRELSSTEVSGKPLDPAKPAWFFYLPDVAYDASNVQEMPWQEGLDFGFSRTLKAATFDETGIWATVDMIYTPDKYLVIRGETETYREKLGYPDNGMEDHMGIAYPYPGILIHPPENLDLETFRIGLRASLENPRKFQTGPKQQEKYGGPISTNPNAF